jgi:hypothetical protein
MQLILEAVIAIADTHHRHNYSILSSFSKAKDKLSILLLTAFQIGSMEYHTIESNFGASI